MVPGQGGRAVKVDWKDGTVVSPRQAEYHQHFNTGPNEARYLALRLGDLDTRWQEWAGATASDAGEGAGFYAGIPREREDPAIYDLYVQECDKHGATVLLPRPDYVMR